MLSPQVASRLAQIDMVFHPYGANEINDILKERVKHGIREGVLDQRVIGLCSALAAQEHGDARRALDLLRIAVMKAQQMGHNMVDNGHVRLAQSQLEHDQLTPVLRPSRYNRRCFCFRSASTREWPKEYLDWRNLQDLLRGLHENHVGAIDPKENFVSAE